MNRKIWIASAAMAVLLMADGSAMAQSRRAEGPALPPPAIEWDKKRLAQLERNVRKLEAQLNRNRDPNAPPTVIEPDPEVVALQAQVRDMSDKLTDMEGTVRNLSGDLERANFDLARAKQETADARAAVDPLRQRLSDLDARLLVLEQGGASQTGSEEANLGDPQPEFDAAMKLMNDQAYTEAGAAFQAFITKWPDSALTPEAHYRLGESLYVRDEAALAAQSYARALKGWPTARWAAEATLKLATSLANVGRNAEACAAVGEFGKRYASTSSANAKNRAASIKSRAKCA